MLLSNRGIIERNQIIHDLKNVEPIRDHRLLLTSDYGINIMNNKISLTIAEKTVMQDAIIRNTKEVSYRIRKRKGKTEERKLQIVPKRHEIGIERKSLVYVPKWNITFRSGDFEYKRMALAASCIFVADEIALCDMHSSLALKYGIDIRGLSQYVKYVAEHFAMTIFLELIKCIIAKTIYLVTHKC